MQRETGQELTEADIRKATRPDLYESVNRLNIHPVEIETIQQIMQRETGQELTEADIRKAARPYLNESVYLRKYLRSVRRQLKLEDRSKIVQAVADVIKSDTKINVLEIDFFYQVANALCITLVEPLGLTA